MEKKLDSNYIRMLRAVLKKSWMQHPTKKQLYSHLRPTTKTIELRRTKLVGHCWRSKDELISDIHLWTPHMDEQRLDDQLEPIYNCFAPIQDVAWRTCRGRCMIETGGQRERERERETERERDRERQRQRQGNLCKQCNKMMIYIYIYMCVCVCVCVWLSS